MLNKKGQGDAAPAKPGFGKRFLGGARSGYGKVKGAYGGWRQGRAEAKAKAAAQAQAGAAQPPWRSTFGSRYAPEPRYGGVAAIFVIIAILLLFLQVFGIFQLPGIGFIVLMFGLLAVLAFFFMSRSRTREGYRRWGSAVLIFILVGGLGYATFWMQGTFTGRQVSGQLGVGGVQVTEGLRGVTGPLNIFGQIITGTYNPENLWRSDTVESQYADIEDVGVVLVDVRPLQPEFSPEDELIITGRLRAANFPQTEVTAVLSACSDNCKDTAWTCEPSRFTTNRIRNTVFDCSHAPLGREIIPFTTEVSATALDTTLIAGKQFVYTSTDALLALPPDADPLEAFGISKRSLQSWQKGDESVNVGIGIAGDPDVLETRDIRYLLGVNVENPATHTGTARLRTLELFVPIARPNLQATGTPDFACQPISQQDIKELNLPQGVALQKCIADFGGIRKEPGERLNAFLQIKIDEDQLVNQRFSTFFVLARLKYDYTNKRLLPLEIKRPV